MLNSWNDGALWCEHPLQVQVFFALARLKELADKDPSMKERQPFKAFLEHDLKTIHSLGKQANRRLTDRSNADSPDRELMYETKV